MEKLVHEGISAVMPMTWKKMIQHIPGTKYLEDHLWDKEALYELMMECFIIDVGNRSEESSSSSEFPVLKRTNLVYLYALFLQAHIRATEC